MYPVAGDFEYQERLAIRFRAGYDSVFGDGNLVEADLCQHCVKEVLTDYLRITRDDPFEPRYRLDGKPAGGYQDYQLDKSPGKGRDQSGKGFPK